MLSILIVPGPLPTLSHFISQQFYNVASITTLPQMSPLWFRDVKKLTQGHTANGRAKANFQVDFFFYSTNLAQKQWNTGTYVSVKSKKTIRFLAPLFIWAGKPAAASAAVRPQRAALFGNSTRRMFFLWDWNLSPAIFRKEELKRLWGIRGHKLLSEMDDANWTKY